MRTGAFDADAGAISKRYADDFSFAPDISIHPNFLIGQSRFVHE